MRGGVSGAPGGMLYRTSVPSGTLADMRCSLSTLRKRCALEQHLVKAAMRPAALCPHHPMTSHMTHRPQASEAVTRNEQGKPPHSFPKHAFFPHSSPLATRISPRSTFPQTSTHKLAVNVATDRDGTPHRLDVGLLHEHLAGLQSALVGVASGVGGEQWEGRV